MMTKIVKLFVAFTFFSSFAFAQEEPTLPTKQTLLGGKISKIGLVGGLEGQYTTLNGSFKPAMGGSVSLLFNEKFGIGLAGYSVHNPNAAVGDVTTRAGVGGLKLEYIATPSKLVHLSFPVLIGMGRASTDTVGTFRGGYDGRGGKGGGHGGRFDVNFGGRGNNGTSFVVIQPAVNVEVNVLKYLAIYGGINYRLALNSSSTTLTNSDLSGLGVQLGIKAGIFGFPLDRIGRRKSN